MEALESKVFRLSDSISVFESSSTDFDYEALCKEGLHYCKLWNVICNHAKSTDNKKANFYIGTYLSQELKSYAIFLRNSALEIIYADLKLKAGLINEQDYGSFIQETKDYIDSVRVEFHNEILNVDESIARSELPEMAHQNNPAEIYSEQFSVLNKQIKEVKQFGDQCLAAERRLEFLREKIVLQFNERIQGLKMVKYSLAEISGDIDPDHNWGQVLNRISKLLIEFKDSPVNDIDAKKIFGTLGSIQAIPEYENGLLKTSTVNFPIGIRQLFTIKFGTVISEHNLHVSSTLADIVSQLRLISNQSELIKEEDKLSIDYDDVIDSHIAEEEKILHDIENNATLHALIYQYSNLKDSTVDYGAQHFNEAKELCVAFIKNPRQHLITWVDRIKRRGDNLPENRHIISYIKVFYNEDTNKDYSRIFLNNSEFFNHYFVDRVELTSRITLNIENWKIGLGNSILIKGDRYSGKSSLLSWIENKTDFHQKIQISIGENVVVGGRKILFNSDLSIAINDILKSIDKNKSYAILIDDLELFVKNDVVQKNRENLNTLIKHIGSAPKNVFFVVATNSWMARRIDTMYSWKEHFADIIDVSKFTLNQFLETLETRNASTKMKITHEENHLTESQLRSTGIQVFGTCKNNVGLSLMAWCRNISNDLQVKSLKVKLPDFPWLVDDLRRFFDVFALNKKLDFDEVIKLDNITDPVNKNLIGRFRKIGILEADGKSLSLSPFVENELVRQLSHSEKKAVLKRYILEVQGNEDADEIEDNLFNLLFTFPYIGEAKLYNIKPISEGLCLVELETIEQPVTIIKYLNNHSDLRAEYKSSVS